MSTATVYKIKLSGTMGSAFFEATEREPGRLNGTIQILDVPHHVEMIEVEATLFGWEQRAKHPEHDELYEQMVAINDELGKPQAVELDGRKFVVHVFPHAE